MPRQEQKGKQNRESRSPILASLKVDSMLPSSVDKEIASAIYLKRKAVFRIMGQLGGVSLCVARVGAVQAGSAAGGGGGISASALMCGLPFLS